MIRKMLVMIMVLSFALLAGCGGGDAPPQFTGQVLSSQRADGDISLLGGIYTPTLATASQNLLFGLDNTGAEYRAFLTFPLDGTGGGSVIPANARVSSAYIDLLVNRVDFSTTVPTRIDLIAYPTNGPTQSDYNSLPLTTTATGAFNVFSSDALKTIRVDVTFLVREALLQGRLDAQFRLCMTLFRLPLTVWSSSTTAPSQPHRC